MSGSTPAVSTKPAVPSFRRLSIRCIDGTTKRDIATLTLLMCRMALTFALRPQLLKPADGSPEGGHFKSFWLQESSVFSPAAVNGLV